jgi:hypothetical protein
VRTCEGCKRGEATHCAALTDSDSIVIAHRFLCEACAQDMFAVNVKQIVLASVRSGDHEVTLQSAVDRVKAKSSSNERIADDEKVLDEIL